MSLKHGAMPRQTARSPDLQPLSPGTAIAPTPMKYVTVERMNVTELQMLYAAGERDFRNVDLSSASLSYIDLSGATLVRANLRHANLRWANLRYANLSWADLRGADLSWADLHNTNLSHANLKGAKMPDGTIQE